MYISQTHFFYKGKGIGFSNAYVRKYEMILKIIAEKSYLGCLIQTHILLFLLVKEAVWQYVSCLYKFLAQKLCHGKKRLSSVLSDTAATMASLMLNKEEVKSHCNPQKFQILCLAVNDVIVTGSELFYHSR